MELKQTYIICATQRSGSTLLCHLLKNTGLAGAPGELFIPLLNDIRTGKSFDLVERIQTELAQRASANGVSGVKLMNGQLERILPVLRQTCKDPGLSNVDLLNKAFPNLSFIWITREDKLRQAISLSRAEHTQAWEKHNSGQAKRPSWHTQVTPFYLQAALKRVEERELYWEDFFARNQLSPFQISYEELVANRAHGLLDCLAFLNIEAPQAPLPQQTTLRKQSDLFTEFLMGYYHVYFALYRLLPRPIFTGMRRLKQALVTNSAQEKGLLQNPKAQKHP